MKAPSAITILLPCRDQKIDFLKDAIDSIREQTSPSWFLFVITAINTPKNVMALLKRYELQDRRIKTILRERDNLASAYNTGMEQAKTNFVCALLSDDKLDKKAIETLEEYMHQFPAIDFFYSSRRFIDANGTIRTPVLRPPSYFSLEYFKRHGSPVKHLMCWRKDKALKVGGMDEKISRHGCDDFDFPWCMAEHGAKFMAIKECLYYYRVHHKFTRLTTHVPPSEQLRILKIIFKKHRVSKDETAYFLTRALDSYLLQDQRWSFGPDPSLVVGLSSYWKGPVNKKKQSGYRFYVLPRMTKVALKSFRKSRSKSSDQFKELCFFEETKNESMVLILQRRSLGKADIFINKNGIYVLNGIQNSKSSHCEIVVNAALNLALEKGLNAVFIPRNFRNLKFSFEFEKNGKWQRIEVTKNKSRIDKLTNNQDIIERGRTIAICNQFQADTDLTRLDEFIRQMNCIESNLGIQTTRFFSIDAMQKKMMNEKNTALGLALPDLSPETIKKLKEQTYRGCFCPRDVRIPELLFLIESGFEWVALPESVSSEKIPHLENGITKIPVMDWRHSLSTEEKVNRILAFAKESDFSAFYWPISMNSQWLKSYECLLKILKPLGNLKSLDQVADEELLLNAEPKPDWQSRMAGIYSIGHLP